MTIPHKHAKLIKAWADGAEIQFRQAEYLNWRDCKNNNPQWILDVEYRVKPAPCVPYRRYLHDNMDAIITSICYFSPGYDAVAATQMYSGFIAWIDNDWITHEVP